MVCLLGWSFCFSDQLILIFITQCQKRVKPNCLYTVAMVCIYPFYIFPFSFVTCPPLSIRLARPSLTHAPTTSDRRVPLVARLQALSAFIVGTRKRRADHLLTHTFVVYLEHLLFWLLRQEREKRVHNTPAVIRLIIEKLKKHFDP